MKVHFLNVGHGDMTLIETDNLNFLIDCNISNENDSAYKHLEETFNNKVIDYLIVTHPDHDHIRGLKILVENGFDIKNIWESGFRKDESEEVTDAYKYFLKLAQDKSAVTLKASSKIIPLIYNDIDIYCFSSQSDSKKDIHFNSLVLKFDFGGKSVLFTGDSNCEAWKNKIIPTIDNTLLEVDILHASHHGSRTFFYENGGQSREEEKPYEYAIDEINPNYTIISGCSDEDKPNEDWPPHDDAVELYTKKTSSTGSVYITGNEDNIMFEIESGDIYITENIKSDVYNFIEGKKPRKLEIPRINVSSNTNEQVKTTWG